jgi:hypothetical protein
MMRHIATRLFGMALLGAFFTPAFADNVPATWELLSRDAGSGLTFNADPATGPSALLRGYKFNGSNGVVDPGPYAVSYGANGVGVDSGSDNYHTVDASSGFDFILFDFGAGASISLQSVSMHTGWSPNTDTDFAVYAFTDTATLNLTTLNGLDLNVVASGGTGMVFNEVGWELVTSQNGTTSTNTDVTKNYSFNPGATKSSQYWIVAAMEYADGASTGFKLTELAGTFYRPPPSLTATGVPVPGTLALLGIGALLSRRKFLKLS